jgi:CheY-like chemotaxis protein
MMQSIKVMVIDDDDDLRETVCELLVDAGHQPIGMSGGAAALAYLRGPLPKPEVILLDLMMPQMNGWEFREIVLQDPALHGIALVVMSASRDVRGISANEVLYKPVQLDALLAAIETHAGAPSPGA